MATNPVVDSHTPPITDLQQEIQQLKQALKKQEQRYEQSHLELIRLMVESEQQAKELKRLNRLVGKAFLNTIEIIQSLIELREPGYREHSNRVAEISRNIARKKALPGMLVQQIAIAARIHEIGKISIPDAILFKPMEQLNEAERKLRKQHYFIGAQLLAKIPSFCKIAKIIGALGEHVDGSGIPEGLTGESIPLGSRIIALVNRWDTLFFVEQVADSPEEALALIEKQLHTVFDPDIFPLLKAEVLARYSAADRPHERQVSVSQLKPGMVLSREVRTVTNVLLLPAGVQLDERQIFKLQQYQTVDPIQGGIFIKR